MAIYIIITVIYLLIGFLTTVFFGNTSSYPEEECVAFGIFWPIVLVKFLYKSFWFVYNQKI